MSFSHKLLTGLVTAGLVLGSTLVALPSWAADKVTLRMSCPCTETDLRSKGLQNVFAAKVSSFADYQPHYNARCTLSAHSHGGHPTAPHPICYYNFISQTG